MRRCLLSPALTLLLLGPPTAAQTTWHVDAAGTPPGSGTATDPYVSIQYAIDQPATALGDVFRVAPGTYAGFSGQAAPRVTIESTHGPEQTHVVGNVDLDASTLLGFTARNPGGTAVEDGRAEQCVITDSAVGFFGGASDWVVSCTIVGCAIGIEDQPIYGGVWIYDCVLYGNSVDMSQNGDYYCTLWETWDSPTNGLLSNSYDPGFWDAASGDFRLRADSPGIGIGCFSSDLGAFPFDPTYLPTPDTYCTSKVTSGGCQPTIGWNASSDAASLSAREPFEVTAAGVTQNKAGHFYFGIGPMAPVPIQGSWLCVLPPTARTPNQSSGSAGATCSGAYAFDFNAHVQSGATPFLSPGMGIYGQYWYRDPADPSGSARTDAIGFALEP